MEEQKPKNLTPTQIHKITGIPIRTISQWQSQGTIPKSSDISIIIQAILKYKNELIDLAKQSGSGDEDEQMEANIALTWERYRKEKLQNDITEGTLVLASEVGQTWAKIIMAMKSKLTSIPSKLAHRLLEQDNPTVIEDILKTRIDEVLNELGAEDFADSSINSERSFSTSETEA